jgi:hypothetical protein
MKESWGGIEFELRIDIPRNEEVLESQPRYSLPCSTLKRREDRRRQEDMIV